MALTMLTVHREEQYMQRCFDLALLGAGRTSPNPLVGAVLVHQDTIIGEGYHAQYGGPHAEVQAIAAVPPEKRALISQSTLYVSLEPCCITGKTGACTNLIIRENIPRVVVSCLDMTPGVAGQGLDMLRSAGISVTYGVLQQQGELLSRSRNHFVQHQTPYITLKYAVTPTGLMASIDGSQTWISHPLSRRFTHRLRSECDAILIGTQTARNDNPGLDNRYYFGPSPMRIVLDRHLSLPDDLNIFDGHHPTLIVNARKNQSLPERNLEYVRMDFDETLLPSLMALLHARKIKNLLVEPGPRLLHSLYSGGYWHEAYVITGKDVLRRGIPAPACPGSCVDEFSLGDDHIRLYR